MSRNKFQNYRIGLIETRQGLGGGNIYKRMVGRALSQKFTVKKFQVSPKVFPKARRLRMLAKIIHLNKKEKSIDLWIRNFLSVVGMKGLHKNMQNIALFFHIDDDQIPNKWLSRILDRKFWKNIHNCDRVIVIAKYWKNFMKVRGVKNIQIIYHGHDISDFIFTESEIDDFKERHGLTGKPVVYLGNCQKNKGVCDAYRYLKDLPYHLVTSGKKEVDLPARHLELTYREYLLLLKSASVVLTMSKFLEGWNITAHEAMLCRTPVIGSGTGGMRELLEGGNQIICQDFAELPETVDYAMNNAEQLGIKGYEFAKNFSFERFQTEWINLVQSFYPNE
jgi:glycosyltransferase involved in cell wall biosynthesis